MADIVNVYGQSVGAMRFIGKQYGDADRVGGMFGKKWDEFFQNGWFGVLEGLTANPAATCEDGGAYIGLMREKEGEPFQYWVGMFLPAGTPVPDGFQSVDFPAGNLAVAWLKGPESEVYKQECKCAERFTAEGYVPALDAQGAFWCFERYACPRFTTPDDKGAIILDICFYVK